MKLKLLFITRNFQYNLEKNTYYLSCQLAKITDLALWFESGNIDEILNKIPFRPDFILLNDMKDTHCPEVTGLKTVEIPFGIIMHDLHYKVKKRKEFIKENNVKHIFSIYRDAFYKRYPEFFERMRWLPHFVNTHIFKDYNLPRENNWLMMGRVSKYYPLRRKMLEVMGSRPGFVYHKHPGYRTIQKEEENTVFIGEKYAKEINRSHIFLTCDLIYHYPIIKYYEVLACKTLLLAPSSKELYDLGFLPGVHFVEINESNFLRMADYYLKYDKERHRIIEQGFNLIHQHHTVEKRAYQLVQMIEDILKSGY